MGGAVILKLLGELGNDTTTYNIQGSVVMSVPFDLQASTEKMDQSFSRMLYVEVKFIKINYVNYFLIHILEIFTYNTC